MFYASHLDQSQPGDIAQFISENKDSFKEIPGISGSFKSVRQISPKFGVATIAASADGVNIFEKERQLLEILRKKGLPAINYYGDVFDIDKDKAMIIEWVQDAVLLDAKDMDLAQNKLLALTLGVNIPLGEGWVLHKERIEKDITAKIDQEHQALENIKAVVQKILVGAKHISKCLDDNALLVCDLQLLITKQGDISVIDPLDVVSRKETETNRYTYTSLLDMSKQSNPDFIQQIMASKRLLSQTASWCEKVIALKTQQELIDFVVKGKEPVMPARSMLEHFRQKHSPRANGDTENTPRNNLPRKPISVKSIPIQDSEVIVAIPQVQPYHSALIERARNFPALPLDLEFSLNAQETTPNTSPRKVVTQRTSAQEMPSPSKVLSEQLNQFYFDVVSSNAKKRLILDDESTAAGASVSKEHVKVRFNI